LTDINDYAIIQKALIGITIQTAALNKLLHEFLETKLPVSATSLLAFFSIILDKIESDVRAQLETNAVYQTAVEATAAQYRAYLLKHDAKPSTPPSKLH